MCTNCISYATSGFIVSFLHLFIFEEQTCKNINLTCARWQWFFLNQNSAKFADLLLHLLRQNTRSSCCCGCSHHMKPVCVCIITVFRKTFKSSRAVFFIPPVFHFLPKSKLNYTISTGLQHSLILHCPFLCMSQQLFTYIKYYRYVLLLTFTHLQKQLCTLFGVFVTMLAHKKQFSQF